MSTLPRSGLLRRASSAGVELVVKAASVDARLEVGTTAWSVFEVLALATETVDGALVVRSSIREVAARLGIGKDRAAAAFAVLRDAGWIELRRERVAASARFASAVYVVHAVEIVAGDEGGGEARVRRVEAKRSRVSSCETARRLFGDDDDDVDGVGGGWE